MINCITISKNNLKAETWLTKTKKNNALWHYALNFFFKVTITPKHTLNEPTDETQIDFLARDGIPKGSF